ncbi:DUF2637 domain-containing protein [Amycolatopsis decaplanina]|uniref:DUF2637 domain-containing protein n=1 Tax=Amycolatopsis decaplanina DSM 44594 TaxID=1284240 RepID=M2XPW1_9PSEU|nr:DUF2637 domain-containing protein [Amycolatopsis decaplanina]EME51220.1 hypothetical protein H074_37283 [Amycolatopsis decaplanina DSM 44594]
MRLHSPVALGAAYASYRHRRDFALQFGADRTTAAIWPLIVDGLLMIATVELWKPTGGERTGGRWTAWLAFIFDISLSLCANIGSTPDLSVLGVTVAACPRWLLNYSTVLSGGAGSQRLSR